MDGDTIVYVGQSSDLTTRLRTHREDGEKHFDDAVWWPCEDEEMRLRLETVLIVTHLPRYNRGIALGCSAGKIWEIRWKRRKPAA